MIGDMGLFFHKSKWSLDDDDDEDDDDDDDDGDNEDDANPDDMMVSTLMVTYFKRKLHTCQCRIQTSRLSSDQHFGHQCQHHYQN